METFKVPNKLLCILLIITPIMLYCSALLLHELPANQTPGDLTGSGYLCCARLGSFAVHRTLCFIDTFKLEGTFGEDTGTQRHASQSRGANRTDGLMTHSPKTYFKQTL